MNRNKVNRTPYTRFIRPLLYQWAIFRRVCLENYGAWPLVSDFWSSVLWALASNFRHTSATTDYRNHRISLISHGKSFLRSRLRESATAICRKWERKESNLHCLPLGNRFTVCRNTANRYRSPIYRLSRQALPKVTWLSFTLWLRLSHFLCLLVLHLLCRFTPVPQLSDMLTTPWPILCLLGLHRILYVFTDNRA